MKALRFFIVIVYGFVTAAEVSGVDEIITSAREACSINPIMGTLQPQSNGPAIQPYGVWYTGR